MIETLNGLLFSVGRVGSLAVIALFMALFAFIAYRNRHLSISGAIAAFVLGTCVMYIMGTEGFLLLFSFYASSYFISHVRKKVCHTVSDPEAKGSRRDWAQVVANGLCCFLAALMFSIDNSILASAVFCASLAESTSDTWAGEIGRMSHNNPVSIITGLPVKKGMSGGVTLLGLIAGFAGSLFICIVWASVSRLPYKAVFVSLLSGFAGCIADSVLGASVQAVYEDFSDGSLTERSVGKDGRAFRLVRGIRWIDNDMVNLISNVLSSVLAMGLVGFLIY